MPRRNNKFFSQFVGSHNHVATWTRTAKTTNNLETRQSSEKEEKSWRYKFSLRCSANTRQRPRIRACSKFQNWQNSGFSESRGIWVGTSLKQASVRVQGNRLKNAKLLESKTRDVGPSGDNLSGQFAKQKPTKTDPWVAKETVASSPLKWWLRALVFKLEPGQLSARKNY